jgi:hypothetical protein
LKAYCARVISLIDYMSPPITANTAAYLRIIPAVTEKKQSACVGVYPRE